MNDTNALATQPQKLSTGYSATAELAVELAKMLALVAPITMTAEQQELWLRAAVDSLTDIRPSEVQAVSAEVRRSVTRPSQIVPKLTELVAERRKRPMSTRSPLTHADVAREWAALARDKGDLVKAEAWERKAAEIEAAT